MPSAPQHREQRRQLALIALTQVFGLSVWFSSTAVVPHLIHEWHITATQAAWLSMSTQLGFAAGALSSSLSGVLDRFSPHKVLGLSALLAAALTACFAGFVQTLIAGIAIRFLLGICFAGMYPPGLKLTASWSLTNRARSFGLLGGCLTIGSSLPYLLGIFHDVRWQYLVLGTATACAGAGVLSLLWIRSGPFLEPRSRVGLSYAWKMFQHPGARASCVGYFGHMFELYAVWTWLPIFMMHSLGQAAMTPPLAVMVFACLGIGGFLGCTLGGVAAERLGRERVASIALATSGLCCVLSPFVFGASPPVLMLFAFVWGAAVIADSGLFSAMLSSAANQRAVGTALSVQTAVGFVITIFTIQITPMVADAYGWKFAFPYLALGPLFAVVAVGAWQPLKRSTVE
ncbi:MFS transporter [Cupriavidus sp. TA19]|uniref:MFS transporter n=1 Tax=Cupriavidus sp. TA19 TaxID=701108 RepID=UPI0027294232|nr:MFS transporter [Cupriavidus sp. TA19]GLC94278.1 MFS transporter [Cupriavidus sp. TA19]